MHPKRREFKGVVAAIITPYDRDGNLAEDVFRKVMESNIQAGVHGFWVAGGTGESVYLTDEERIRLAELSVDQARGRAKIILHAGALTTRSTVRIAKGAAAAGVDAIASIPPMFYKPSDEAIVGYYKAVGEATDLPLFLYNLPSATGTELLPPLVERLTREVPTLAGLKHSVLDLYKLRAFAQMDLAAFIGACGMQLSALTLGAAGTVDGPPTVWPEPYVETYNAYVRGDLKRAQEAQEKGIKFIQLIWNGPFPDRFIGVFKAILTERLGVDCGAPRPPLLAVPEDGKAELLKRAEALGILKATASRR
ncbi:MAG: dihydrodipicolinate synthase family protein [Chloroflexota bacterium]|nr:dihydrodipicolinate synthase family protein [Chloroflexota bacterium]